MVDPESVRRRLREIGRRLSRLERVREAGRDGFLADSDLQAATERHFQIAIQAAIDIAVHILAEDSDETPEDYADAFIKLGRVGVIDEALAERLTAAAGFRNILVHAYLEVDPVLVWSDLDSLEDFRAFSEAIEQYLVG
ncbi:MAG: DUF86 domain-containing protein [Actinomycetota bacterium]|nr:DUF86 domain-containing protein [Actinomycetota bacterium]